MKNVLIVFLFIGLGAYSQKTIQGTITDSKTQLSLAYVNIGIPGTNMGTVSNSNGEFRLSLDKEIQANDTVQFSFIGYKTQQLPVSSLAKKGNKIELVPMVTQIQDVVFSSEKPKHKKLGRTGKGLGMMWYNFYTAGEQQNDRLSKEAGMRFKLKSDFRLNSLHFFIGQNEYKSIKFRMNIYKIEKDVPTKLLNKEDIIFEVKNEYSGWFVVDLDSYNIYLKEKLDEVAVTIQWLESEKNDSESKFFAISVGMSPFDTMFFREKGMASWQKNKYNLSFYLEVDSFE